MHDVYHGVWHVLAAVFCVQAALITVEGLTGRLDTPIGGSREEWVAMLAIVVTSCLFPLLHALDATFWVYMHLFAAVELIILLGGGCALRAIVGRHRRRMERVAGEDLSAKAVDGEESHTVPRCARALAYIGTRVARLCTVKKLFVML